MTRFEYIRLRGSVVAVAMLFTIVSLLVILDRPASSSRDGKHAATPTTTTPKTSVAITIPFENRLCGLAQRALDPPSPDESAAAAAMLRFYSEAATFTDGDLGAEFAAAARFYKEVTDIAAKANWDVERIVRNNDGPRWRALLTGNPTGVEESRQAVRDHCRMILPEPPRIEVDYAGRIRDPALAKLLAPPDKELRRPPPPEPEAEPEPTPPNPT